MPRGRYRESSARRRRGLWANGGFFVFRQAIFDYLGEGEELVEAPFHRLIEAGKLFAYKHDGFWALDGHLQREAATRRPGLIRLTALAGLG